MDLYGNEKLIGCTDGQTEFGAKDKMHVYGGNSLLTAKDKIEYKAPQMNNIFLYEVFEYTKEPYIVNVFWLSKNAQKTIIKHNKEEVVRVEV